MEWYKDYPHIGYDIDGQRIYKPALPDELDTFLSKMEDPDDSITFFNRFEGQKMKLTKQEVDIINRLQQNSVPDVTYDPYEVMMDSM